MPSNNIIFNLYIDESGNTGANMIDIAQPYFTYGSWLIQDRIENELRDYIKNEIIPEYKKEFSNENELKSTVYFNNASNMNPYREYYDLFCKILGYKAYPFVLLLEKKFITTSYIVETFFNFKFPNNCIEFKELIDLKIDICNIIYNDIYMDENFLINFWDKVFTKKEILPCELDDIKNRILTILKNNSLNNLYNYLEKSNYYTSQKVRTDEFIGNILSRLLISINYEICMQNNKYIKVSVFHDERSDFKYIQKYINKINVNNLLNHINFPLNKKNSQNDVLIQLSDLLAGFFNNMLNIETIDEYATNTIFKYFINDKNECKGVVLFMSYKDEYAFLSKLGIKIIEKKYRLDEIDKSFNNYCLQ